MADTKAFLFGLCCCMIAGVIIGLIVTELVPALILAGIVGLIIGPTAETFYIKRWGKNE